jgi:hypothetical protein
LCDVAVTETGARMNQWARGFPLSVGRRRWWRGQWHAQSDQVAPSLADLFPPNAYLDWSPWRMSPPDSTVSWAGRAWVSLTPRALCPAQVAISPTPGDVNGA